MREDQPRDTGPTEQTPPSGDVPPRREHQRRRVSITPEQRRLLDTGRYNQPAPEQDSFQAGSLVSASETTRPQPREAQAAGFAVPETRGLIPKTPRAVETHVLVIAVAALFLLFGAFYIGKKYERFKDLISSLSRPKLPALASNRFPDTSSDELIEQALVAEKTGNWREAAERFIAAKHKNLRLSGILFRVGKLYYDNGEFDAADQLFERATAFGENVDTSNYFRGMIAQGRDDFFAAQRFFEAAAAAAPFKADYYYSWAETLRKTHRPNEAIPRYEQAARRGTEQEALICRFKARMAMVEAGDKSSISVELQKNQAAGPLSVDWLMTAAAIQIYEGGTDEALRLIREARAADQSRLFSLFAACAGDRLFASAGQHNPELAKACRVANGSDGLPH